MYILQAFTKFCIFEDNFNLQQSHCLLFHYSFKTDNPALNAIISFIVISLSSAALGHFRVAGNGLALLWKAFTDWVYSKFIPGHQLNSHSILLEGTVLHGNGTEMKTVFSSKFRATLHHIINLPLSESKIRHLQTIDLDDMDTVYFLQTSMDNETVVAPGVFATFATQQKQRNDRNATG